MDIQQIADEAIRGRKVAQKTCMEETLKLWTLQGVLRDNLDTETQVKINAAYGVAMDKHKQH